MAFLCIFFFKISKNLEHVLLVTERRRLKGFHPAREEILSFSGEVILVFFQFDHENILVPERILVTFSL